MPKTKTQQVNHLSALLQGYKRAVHLTDEKLAEKLQLARGTVCRKLNQPAGDWDLAELVKFCAAIDCPILEAFEAAAKSM